jgi:hypothetical protein
MIKTIRDLLQSNQFYGVSENVDIAKGKYAIPSSFSDIGKNIKRRLCQKKGLK